MLDKIEDIITLPSPLTKVELQLSNNLTRTIYIKRDELIHPHICGNKWRKLKYNLVEAVKTECTHLVSYGGAFSNHLVAVAAAGHVLGMKTVGIIRSYTEDLSNTTIDILKGYGMQLHIVRPQIYKSIMAIDDVAEYVDRTAKYFVIPEGGTNQLALYGVSEAVEELRKSEVQYSHIVLGLGTAGTLAGISRALRGTDKRIVCISPFKGAVDHLEGFRFLNDSDFEQIDIIPHQPPTRFGHVNSELITYIQDFKMKYDIQLDPIYMVKVMMTLEQMFEHGHFSSEDKIVVLHTGGLQGLDGTDKLRGQGR